MNKMKWNEMREALGECHAHIRMFKIAQSLCHDCDSALRISTAAHNLDVAGLTLQVQTFAKKKCERAIDWSHRAVKAVAGPSCQTLS
jgi:hypothetical protein